MDQNDVFFGQRLLDLIPQRPPMVMLDELVEVKDDSAVSRLTILPQNILVDNGFFVEEGMLENVAQTCAAMAGFQRLSANEEIQKGFIVGIKDVVVHRRPQIDKTITTSVKTVMNVMNMKVISAHVRDKDGECLDCEMRIFLEENPDDASK